MAQIELGDPISIANGFTVQITNFDSQAQPSNKYRVGIRSNSARSTPLDPTVSSEGIITVKNMIPTQKATVQVDLPGSSTVVSKEGAPSLQPAHVPELTNLVSTKDGFTVTIANLNKDYEFKATSPNTEIKKDRVVRTGLKRGQRGPVTITTSRSGYESGTATVTHFADPLIPTFDNPKSRNEEGWTAQLTNYTTNTDYIWTFVAVDGIGQLGASPNVPAVSPRGLLTVRGLSGAGTTSGVKVTISRGNSPSWVVVDGVNEYESGEETIIGTSLQPSERWIHVGLLGPATEHKPDNNNDQRTTYDLKRTSGATIKSVPMYEISFISHLTPAEMRLKDPGNKDVLHQGEELNVNETTENVENTLFRHYWSQQNNLKIIEGADNTSIKLKGQNYTSTFLSPIEILNLLTKDDEESEGLLNKISYWGNLQDPIRRAYDVYAPSKRPYGMVESEELPLTFLPSLWKFKEARPLIPPGPAPAQSLPHELNLVQTLKSGWFDGITRVNTEVEGPVQIGGKFIHRDKPLAYQLYNTKKFLLNPLYNTDEGTPKRLGYPLEIEVCVILEYQIEGEVKEYEDFITSTKLPTLTKTTKYTLNKRVPIKMKLPYQMVREFTSIVRNWESFRNALDGTASVLSLETIGSGHYGYKGPNEKEPTLYMEDFQAHLLKEIPEIIQKDIDIFLIQGPLYYDTFDEQIMEGNTGILPTVPVKKINFKKANFYLDPTSTTDKFNRRPRARFFPKKPGCYYYNTFNINLDSLQAATSDIFISGLTIHGIAPADGTRLGINSADNPVMITFYNDLDRNPDVSSVSSVPPTTNLGLEVSHVFSNGRYDMRSIKDLIPQFYDDKKPENPARYYQPFMGVRMLMGGISQNGVPKAGWVQTKLFHKESASEE